MRWFISGIAALTIGLVAAPVAGADANDDAFIEATDDVIYGRGNASTESAGTRYPEFLLRSGSTRLKEVCAMMDAEMRYGSKVNDYLVAALEALGEHAGYFAAWFEQISIEHDCPRHSDRIGII